MPLHESEMVGIKPVTYDHLIVSPTTTSTCQTNYEHHGHQL